MLAQLFPRGYPRYDKSPAVYWLQQFADWLISAGYAQRWAQVHVRHLKQVFEQTSGGPKGVTFSASALDVLFAGWDRKPGFRHTRTAFRWFLLDRGRVIVEPSSSRFSALLEAYGRHLSDERGYAASTVSRHCKTADAFLEKTLGPNEPVQNLSAEAVERFVIENGRSIKRTTLQYSVAHLRSFLRFCHYCGALRDRLDAIDMPRTYRGELPPRAIPWRLIQRLLRSIDRSSAAGSRDHAILHLMAHYGLRSSEIVALRLASINWEERTLRVEQRKTRSALALPLGNQTLGVLRTYLRRGRPENACPELFLRLRAPAGPLRSTAICDLYEKRVRESGLPLHATSPYALRHSLAMRLLERGVSVKVIGDLLGHRSFESTCVYLRLQTEALREVALPVPTLTSNLERS